MSTEINNDVFRSNVLTEIKKIQDELNELKNLNRKIIKKSTKRKPVEKTAKRKPAGRAAKPKKR